MLEAEEEERAQALARLGCPIVADSPTSGPFTDPVGLLFLTRKFEDGICASSSLAHAGTMARWLWAGKA